MKLDILKTPELKVGALVLSIGVLVAYFSIKVSEDPGFWGQPNTYWFVVEDASGLVQSGSVKIAGINVGIIKAIRLDHGRAKLLLSVNDDVALTTSTRVEIRPNGILGDKYVEIIPGSPDDPVLESGSQINLVHNKASLNSIMDDVGKITKSLGEVAEIIKLAASDEGASAGPLGRIIHHIDRITSDLAELTSGQKDRIGEIIANVHEITGSLEEALSNRNGNGFGATWAKLERALTNIEEITEKIKSGKGTIGKLVNDEKTVEELNTAISSVNNFLGSTGKIQTSVDFRSEYLTQSSLTKTYFGLKIQPGLDRYYELQVVDDPRGVVERTETRTVSNPGQSNESVQTTRESKTHQSRLKFTALFAKNFYDTTFKGGLIESSGGVGVDQHLFNRRVRISFDAYEFSKPQPHLRASLRYMFYKGVYVVGGGDDMISGQGQASSYIGAGLDLTNDDLKAFVSKVSF